MAKKRNAGDGLIRQRTDGRWEGRYVVGYDDHGYPKTKAVFGKSKRECTEKLAALKAQLGGIPSDKLRPEMRFADWLDYWYETHCKPNIRTSTQSGYEDRIRLHIKPELGEIPLNRLTQNDLQQFYARLKKSGRKTRTEYYGEMPSRAAISRFFSPSKRLIRKTSRQRSSSASTAFCTSRCNSS